MEFISMIIQFFHVMKIKSNFLFKFRKIYFIKNPKMQSARVEEYTIENLPKDRDFQKKYILLDHFIGQLKIQSMKNTQNMI